MVDVILGSLVNYWHGLHSSAVIVDHDLWHCFYHLLGSFTLFAHKNQVRQILLITNNVSCRIPNHTGLIVRCRWMLLVSSHFVSSNTSRQIPPR
jgi:hypothetical protein